MNYEASIFYSKRLNEEFQYNEGSTQNGTIPTPHHHAIFDEFSPHTAFHIQ